MEWALPRSLRPVNRAGGRVARMDSPTRERSSHMAEDKLSGKRVAFLVAPEGIEQVELTEPWKAVEAAGGKPELLSTDSGEVQAFNHLDKADTFGVDRTVADADVSDY